MGQVGRKAKKGKRQPNGQLRRPTLAELKGQEHALRMAETQAVLNQPHRLGNSDPRIGSEFGRFTVNHKVAQEIFDAGEHYGAVMRRWRSAMGIPTTERLNEGGKGDGPSRAAVKSWEREIDDADAAMARADMRGAICVKNLVADHIPVPAVHIAGCVAALVALACETGHMERPRHRPMDIGKQALDKASKTVP